MKADVLSVLRTCVPVLFSHQRAGGGNPCPYLQPRTRWKGRADTDTRVVLHESSHAVCSRNNKKPSERLEAAQHTTAIWPAGYRANPTGALWSWVPCPRAVVKMEGWVLCFTDMHPAELATCLMFRPLHNISFSSGGPRVREGPAGYNWVIKGAIM